MCQLFVYYIQDLSLLQVEKKFMAIQKIRIISFIQNWVKNILFASAIVPSDTCLPEMGIFGKVSITLCTSPIMVICLFVGLGTLCCLQKRQMVRSWNSHIFLAILLSVMYSSQKITSTLFSLIHCILINKEKRLFVYAHAECWQIWQIFVLCYIATGTLPQCLIFLLGPQLLNSGKITKWQFILGLFCPLPCMGHWLILIFRNEKIRNNHPRCLSTLKILDQIQNPFAEKKLSFWFCWTGVISVYRLVLVLCDQLMFNQVHSYFAKSVICLLFLVLVASLKPYKSEYLNISYAFGLFSQVLIGFFSSIYAMMNSALGHVIPSVLSILYVQQLLSILTPLILALSAVLFALKIKMLGDLESFIRKTSQIFNCL